MIKTIDAEQLPEYICNGPNLPEELGVYIHGDEEGNLPEGSIVERLLKIEDFFGWDYIVKIPTGQLVLTDRNCGFYTIVSQQDFDQLLVDLKDDIVMDDD